MKSVLLIEDQRSQSLVIERMLKNACPDIDVTRTGRLDEATEAGTSTTITDANFANNSIVGGTITYFV